MTLLELKDSSFIEGKGVSKDYSQQCAAFMDAVDHLKKQYEDGQLEIVHLQSYNPRINVETPIWYEIKSYGTSYNKTVVSNCEFFSSHYIGRYSNGVCSIVIEPRFGHVFNYLVSYATNLYLPQGFSDQSYANKNAYWLIALLWKAMLNKALTTGQIPKEYQTITKNQKSFRGRLSIAKHIHANLCDASRFYCSYKKLSMDNTINRTIRTIYGILKNKGLSSIVSEFEAYDNYLCSMGVGSEMSDVRDIDNIRYTKLNIPYKPVMELSRTILSNCQAESSNGDGIKHNVSYFIDIAELWEMYLLKLLQNNLSPEYHVYSPNADYGNNLLNSGMREIRPDIIIEKNNRVLMIIDAKYKNYTQFGRNSMEGVKREDLYQMSTYLYHYGRDNEEIVGLFTSPVTPAYSGKEVYSYSHNSHHRIGLANLDITANDENLEIIHANERKYIEQIKELLSEIK